MSVTAKPMIQSNPLSIQACPTPHVNGINTRTRRGGSSALGLCAPYLDVSIRYILARLKSSAVPSTYHPPQGCDGELSGLCCGVFPEQVTYMFNFQPDVPGSKESWLLKPRFSDAGGSRQCAVLFQYILKISMGHTVTQNRGLSTSLCPM